MKKVSIIVPCHNVSDWVYSAWESIKNQTMGIKDIECIFVDDASNDDGKTWAVLQSIEKDCPESVMIIHLDENIRQGGARNVGMQYMSGEYMLFLDADDMYRPETCEELYQKAKQNDLDITQFDHDVMWRDSADSSIPKREGKEEEIIADLSDDELRKMFLNGKAGDFGCTNKFYRISVVREVGSRFAEKMVYEEPLFVYPLFLYIRKMMIVSTKYYIWRKHEGSTMTSELGKRLLEHVEVQYRLMQEVENRTDLYAKYKDEIDFHFFHSFFQETMFFSVINQGKLSVGQCERIKELLFAECPDIENNKYIHQSPLHNEVFRLLLKTDNNLDGWTALIQRSFDLAKEECLIGKE